MAHMASRQEPLPPLPPSQSCPAPSIPSAARARAAAVPLVGCGRTPRLWGHVWGGEGVELGGPSLYCRRQVEILRGEGVEEGQ